MAFIKAIQHKNVAVLETTYYIFNKYLSRTPTSCQGARIEQNYEELRPGVSSRKIH